MNFVTAILAIHEHGGFSLCDDEEELSGKRDVCIYLDEQVVGKLRWKTLSVDLPEKYYRKLVRFWVKRQENRILMAT